MPSNLCNPFLALLRYGRTVEWLLKVRGRTKYIQQTFLLTAAAVSNKFPDDVRCVQSLEIFLRKLKTPFFVNNFNSSKFLTLCIKVLDIFFLN